MGKETQAARDDWQLGVNLETPWQRVAVLAVGRWFDHHSNAIWGFLLGAPVPSVATYLFGHRAGRKSGKTEAYNSAIATAEGNHSGASAAEELRKEAESHGLRVRT